MSVERTERILAERAARLARPLPPPRQDTVQDLLLVTTGAGRRFALPARSVRQVLRDEPLGRLVAGAGAFTAVAIVSGETVPVADLGALLDGEPARRDRPFLVVLDSAAGPVGLLVDRVLDVAAVPTDDLETVSGAVEGAAAAHRRVTPDGAVVLDIEALLGDDRLTLAPPMTTPPTSEPLARHPRGAR